MAKESGYTARHTIKAAAQQPAADPRVKKEDTEAALKQFKAEFAQRVVQLRGRMSVAEFAAKLGVHRNTVWNIERGQSLPDAFELIRMADLFHTTVAALLGQPASAAWAEKSNKAVAIDSFVFVPQFEVQAAVGSFQDVAHVVTMRPFDAAYIRGELGIAHEDIGLCEIIGNSGEPLLHNRDTVLVDFRDRHVMVEGPHIVRLDGLPLLKNLQRLPGKVIRVSSNNESYAPFDVVGPEDSDRDFEVLGRVRWAGVTFR